jgi:hypothetical protein
MSTVAHPFSTVEATKVCNDADDVHRESQQPPSSQSKSMECVIQGSIAITFQSMSFEVGKRPFRDDVDHAYNRRLLVRQRIPVKSDMI